MRYIKIVNKLSLKQKLFLFFWILKPFYILPSGLFQIGDLFLIFSLLVLMVKNEYKITLDSANKYFFYFLLCVIAINGIYSFIYMDFSFSKASLYYIFNFFAIWVFHTIATENFLKTFLFATKINIISQFLLVPILYSNSSNFLFGRYIGTYNDPNQLAFAILCFYIIVYLISDYYNMKLSLIIPFFVFFLIFISSSTGMMMALLIVFEVQIFFLYKKHNRKKGMIYLFLFFIQLLVIIIISLCVLSGYVEIDNFTVKRIIEKVSLIGNDSTNSKSIIEDRLIDKVTNSPFTVLYGAGEGKYERFMSRNGYLPVEIHSTWIGILFYYGVLPFSLLINWMKKILEKGKINSILIICALLLESLTLANQRQPAFWITLSLIYTLHKERRNI